MRHRFTLSRLVLATSVSALTALSCHAATFTWTSTTNGWATPTAWTPAGSPSGTNSTDILNFAGDVNLPYTSINNTAANPFLVNRINLNATGFVAGNAHNIDGNQIAFVGAAPEIVQNGSGGFAFFTPILLDGTLSVSGNGTGFLTANGTVSGIVNIVKTGSSVFRFGTLASGNSLPPSNNTWLGKIQIDAGTVRFNNNAESGRTAVRANPVRMNGVSAVFSCNSEMRFGTLSGSFGDVRTVLVTTTTQNPDSESILITAFEDGDYAGALTLSPPMGSGGHDGELIIRGTGTQTLSGTTNIDEDIVIGRGATLVLAGNASFATSTGSVVLGGGTLRLENENANNDNRLREGGGVSASSTSVQPIGGGTLILAGNAGGTYETTGRLQLGAGGTSVTTGLPESKPRAGHLNIQIVDRALGAAETALEFQNYSRDQQTIKQVATVTFSATNGIANSSVPNLLLGVDGNAPHIYLTDGAFEPPLQNGLLSTTGGDASVGWATIVSPGAPNTISPVDFATHTAFGVAPVTTIPWASATAVDNAVVTGSASTPSTAANFPVNSVKLAPAGVGQSLNIAGSGNLETTAILLSGANDYTIRATGGGGIAGVGPRFFYVDKAALTVEASLAASNMPVVKSGLGLLALTNTSNVNATDLTVINSGTLRATPGTTLPAGELRLRGGVLDIQGGTFARTIGAGVGTVNLSGVKSDFTSEDDDRGSGGFAAFGQDATVTLNSNAAIFWEDVGFARSGHALILNSPTANAMVSFTNSIHLNASSGAINYNSREIRALDNPQVATDWGRVSGVIFGNVNNDLLKTGEGTLELTAANQYLGHTHVNEGRLLVTGSLLPSTTVIARGTGRIGGTGSIGTILLDGGSVAPGNGVGSLTATNLYWRNGTFRADLGVGGNSSDTLALRSGRFYKVPHGAAPYTFDFGGTGEGGRTYTLATFGTTNFAAADFTFANLRAGLNGTFAINSGVLTFATSLPPPSITTHPLTQRVNVGNPVTLSVVTQVPGAYSYQWYKDNQLLPGETASTLSFTPDGAEDSGQFKVTVSDGIPANLATSNVATFTANVAPVATAQNLNTPEDTAIQITLAASDGNPGDTLSVIIPAPSVQHGTFSGSIPNIIYTPHKDYHGPDSFTYYVRDGLLDSSTVTISIIVDDVNDPPTPVTDAIVSDTPFDVIANDTDIDGNLPLSLISVGTPSHGTVVRNGNSVTYTPGSTFSRFDTFTYVVEDAAGAQNTGTVTVGLAAPTSFAITAKGAQVFGEPAGTFLGIVGQPTVSGDGRVAFVGTYTKPDKKKQTALLFGNPPVPVVRIGVTTAPGGALTYAKVTAPVVNATGELAFKAKLNKAPSGTAEGIWAIDNGMLRKVAQGGMAVPGVSGATFAKFGDIVIPDDGRVIFAATLKGALKTADAGIWRETGSGSVAKVVREGDSVFVGGRTRVATTIALFGPSGKDTVGQRRGFNNGGAVIARVGFSDKTSAIVRFNADGSTIDVGMISDVPRVELANSKVKSFGLPILAEDGGMSFLAYLLPGSGNASATSDAVLLRRSAAGVITLVAQESSAAANIPNSAFKSFSDTVSGVNNRVAFIGTLKAGAGGITKADDVGIWRHSAAGAMEQLAREGKPAPGLNGANFVSFKSLVWTDRVAFVGTARSTVPKLTTTGLWAEDTAGALNLIFHTGKTIAFPTGNKTVKSFVVLGPNLGALGQGGSANFLGGFAILTTFTDKTIGIVTTWVP